jgi:hypothetical protein
MRFGLRAKSVADVNDVKTSLITSRRIIFTPNSDLKEELANTSVQITCYDRNGNEVKRVTSADDGNIEEDNGTSSSSTSGDVEEDNGSTESESESGTTSGSTESGDSGSTDNSGSTNSGSSNSGSGDNSGGDGGDDDDVMA